MFLVRGGAITGFSQLVATMGVNPVALMSQVGLAPSQLRDPNTYVSYSKIAELLERAAEQCRESPELVGFASKQAIDLASGKAQICEAPP